MHGFFKIGIALSAAGFLAGYTYVPETTPGGTTATTTVASRATLTAVVGPSATISLKQGSKKVTSLKAGKYTVVVDDKSRSHNFRLTGPGVNLATTVAQTIKKTWTVTLKKGTYTFICDPHKGFMKGSFKVT